MSAPTIAGTPATGTLSAGTSLTANLPTGITAGEKLVLAVFTTFDVAISTPAGWNPVAAVGDGFGSGRTAVFDKTATGSEGSSVSVTVGSCDATSIAFRVSGQSSAAAISNTNSGTSGSTTAITSPSVTTVSADSIVLRFGQTNESSSIANPGSHTNIETATTGSGSLDNTSRACYEVEASPGGAGTAAFVSSGGDRPWTAITIAYAPAASAAVTGTATASITETDIVSGGKTVIATLSNETFLSDSVPSIAFVAATANTTTAAPGRTNNGDITCTLPATPQQGDLGLIVLYNDQGSGSVPSNWNEVSGSPWGGGTPKLQAFWKILNAGESSPTTTISGSAANASHCAGVMIYRGCKSSGPIGTVGTASNGTGTPMTCGEIAGTNGRLLLGLCGRGDNETSSTQTVGGSGTGVTERMDAGTDQGNDSQVSVYEKTLTSTANTGNGSAATSATDPWVSVFIELIPADTSLFADARAAIRNGLDSAQSEAAGWDAKVKPNIPVGNVVRTSDTVCTITLQAQADYDITAQETVTWTLPAAALTGNTALVATPNFTVGTATGAYTLTASHGSFTLTGQSASLLRGRNVAADQGSFTLSGQDVTLRRGYPMTAAQGAFTLTGQDVALLFKRSMPAAHGTFTLTGNTTDLYRGYPMAAGQGSFTVTGQDVGLRFGRGLAAAFGSFALAGQSVAFLLSRVIAAGVGTFSLSGQDVALRLGRRIAAAFGSFTLTGNDVTLTYGAGEKILGADAGLFTLTGNAVELRQDRRIVVDSGVFTLTGYAAGALWGRRMAASHGTFALTGNSAGLYYGRALFADAGSFALTGFGANLLRTHLMTVTAGSFTLSGQDVQLIFTTAGLQAGAGIFTLTGFDVAFTHFIPPLGALPGGQPRGASWSRPDVAATVRNPGPATTRYAGAPTTRRGSSNTRRR